jgi:hypothetical protein
MPASPRPSLRSRPSRRFAALALAAGALWSSACSLWDTGQPEDITVRVESTGTEPVVLILSREFLASPGSEDAGSVAVQFITSDTILVTPPASRTLPLAPTYRFLARAQSPDSANAATVRLRVAVDGRERYNQSRILGSSYLEFLYLFQ